MGGIQAIAALSQGTDTIPKVDKIFGPGNQYVTAAKSFALTKGVAIDMPAGPSEVLVIADETSNPAYVAADLLSQAEHGADSQVILLSTSKVILEQVQNELENQLTALPRIDFTIDALNNSCFIQLNSLDECFDLSNLYAPEHLILAFDSANEYINQISNAGSVFIGKYSCESAGDYASGTNHTLPTNGYARNYSGVSLDSFVKKITRCSCSHSLYPCSISSRLALRQKAEHITTSLVRLKTVKARSRTSRLRKTHQSSCYLSKRVEQVLT